MPGCNGAGMAERSYPSPRSGAAAGRSYPTPKARGGCREDLPHVQGVLVVGEHDAASWHRLWGQNC